MVARLHAVRYTYRDYLDVEDESDVKHEFLDGQIYAMAGGTPEHAMLIRSVSTHLAVGIRDRRCRVAVTDLHVRVLATGLATYPDAAVICGRWERDPQNPKTVLNPSVIVEVLSPTTEAYDRQEKFEHYKQIPSLRHYVLIAHDRRAIEVFTRMQNGEWACALATAGQTATLGALECALDVDQVYEDAQEPT